MARSASDAGYSIGLAVLYVLTARLGLTFDSVEGFASLVWLPSGVSLAALLLLGNRLWPGVFAGAVVANLMLGTSVLVAIGIGIGSTGEALAGVYLLRRVRDFNATLGNVRSVVALIILAALTATMISATIGVLSLFFGGFIDAADILRTWRGWWIGDIIGALIVTPVVLVWSRRPDTRVRPHWAEAVAVSLAILVAAVVSFFGDLPFVPSLSSRMHDASALLIVLLWATLRFGPRGAATAAFGISAVAVIATLLGHGPLAQPEPANGLLSLQAFIAIVAATLLLLGAHVSELRLSVASARQSEADAAEANRTKSEFLAVMSHELRTPLNAIAGYAQLLEEGVHGELNDKQHDDVERIQRNEKQLLAHVEDIFGFVNAEKGGVKLTPQTVYVSDAVNGVEPLVRTEFREHGCALRRGHIDADIAVLADPKALQRILASLLSNGSKFCGEQGVVTVNADREGDCVRISIHDTGRGISQDEIDRVFEPFFQADRGLTRKTSGIGLGLTIARDLVRRMDGEITLKGDATGTTASVLLPKASSPVRPSTQLP